jgi:topoisomerase IA-like protein
VEYGFTAAMEDELDAVSRGEEEWTKPLDKFWKPFIDQVEKIEKNVTREQVAQARELGKDPASGKPVTVRLGRFGPFVQIGSKDDEEKPKFAGLRPGQKMDAISLTEALDLFQLPRTLGETAAGEKIEANVGRFGPYVKYGSKYVSLKADDPYTVTLERALEVIRLKQEADANRLILDFPDDGIQVLNGRYGPYITDKKKNAKIPKDRDPKSLTLEECRTLLAQAPERGGRFGRFGRGKKAAAPAAAAGDGAGAAPAEKVAAKGKKKAAATGSARAKGATAKGKQARGAGAHGGAGHGTPGHGAGAHGAAGHTTSGHGAGTHGAAGHTTSGHGAGAHGAAGHGTPGHGAGAHGAAGHGTPGHGASAHGAAGRGTTARGLAGGHASPHASAAAPRAAVRAAAKKAASSSAQSPKGSAKAKGKPATHDGQAARDGHGHKAASATPKAKANAKKGKATKTPAGGKVSSSRARGVK